MPVRLLAVMREEGGELKIVTVHFSVGVPDDVAVERAREWSSVAPPAH
ncbi:MAG TPA: hypothetical protein VNJ53_12275 [Gaiellaceae bacterium]|nr:hypothetical protein [Gaiellaceae bacterium]